MLKRDSIKSNFLFQIIYQAIILIIPLLVSPYLTRHLGDTALGTYNYAYSVAYYFVVFAMLGIQRHGQRVIASCRDDEIKLRKTFWSLFTVHGFFSLLAIISYVIFVCIFITNDRNIFFIQTIYVFSALFDITWLFYGIEKFKSVVVKNAFVKVIELIFIFLFVKTKDDVSVYTLIMSASILAGFVVLLPQALKYVKPISFSLDDMREHLKPLFTLSVSIIAVTIYTMFDKTLLGMLISKESVAYYEYSNKIVSIPKSFIAVIGTVLFPRACAAFASNDYTGIQKYFRYSLIVTYAIGIGAIFGIIAIAEPFSILYFGDSFAVCGEYMKALAPVILIIGLGDIVRTQFLIPSKQDVKFVGCLVINSIINLILNILLIPRFGVYGAIIGTLVAESVGLVIQTYICKKWINVSKSLLLSIPFVISSAMMFLTIRILQHYMAYSWSSLCLQVLAGIVVYAIGIITWLLLLSDEKRMIREKLRNICNITFLNGSVINQEEIHRNLALDVMRIMGISLIILSHTSLGEANILLQNIRDFDVVLMVFISGIVFAMSKYRIRTLGDYCSYVIKRFKRLIFPCWTFITLYLVFVKCISYFIPNDIFNIGTILTSYTLISGFGYVWIIRIFFCMALLAPFMVCFSKYHFIIKNYVVIYVGLLIIEAATIYVNGFLPDVISGAMNVIIIPIFGYGIVYMTAIIFNKLNHKNTVFLILANLFIVVVEVLKNGFAIGEQKYPPNMLYLSYGVLVTIVLFLLLSRLPIHKNGVVLWLSKNSFTMYFAHIFIVFFFEHLDISWNWWEEYFVLIVGSLMICFVIESAKKGIKTTRKLRD